VWVGVSTVAAIRVDRAAQAGVVDTDGSSAGCGRRVSWYDGHTATEGSIVNEHRRVTGRQITTMVLAVCAAAVLAPAGVYAAGHSSVSIADGSHPSRLATVSTSGAESVKVKGDVAVPPSRPAVPFALSGESINNVMTLHVPASGHFVIQNVSAELVVPDAVTIAGLKFIYTQFGTTAHLFVPLIHTSPRDGTAASFFDNTISATLYPDPGSTIVMSAHFDAAVGADTSVSFNGYVVP
jgi:hypothetical protein